MHIHLPRAIVDRVQRRVAIDKLESEADVIRMALDSLDWQDQERQAIQQDIDAWRAENSQ